MDMRGSARPVSFPGAFPTFDAVAPGLGAWVLRPLQSTAGIGDWSPDGRCLVFSLHASSPGCAQYTSGCSVLAILPADGSRRLRYLTAVPRGGVVYDSEPTWSSRNLIAFRRLAGPVRSRSSRVYVIRPDGSGLRRIATTACRPGDWSPSGRTLIGTAHYYQVCTISPATGRVRLLIRNGVSAAYSPDGRRIVFARGAYEIDTMNADGHARRRVAGSVSVGGSCRQPGLAAK